MRRSACHVGTVMAVLRGRRACRRPVPGAAGSPSCSSAFLLVLALAACRRSWSAARCRADGRRSGSAWRRRSRVLLANWPATSWADLLGGAPMRRRAGPWHRDVHVRGGRPRGVPGRDGGVPRAGRRRCRASRWRSGSSAYLGSAVLPRPARWLPWPRDRGPRDGALALAIFVPKVCDIGAYFTGRLLGRTA